jgi:hypothetical protein
MMSSSDLCGTLMTENMACSAKAGVEHVAILNLLKLSLCLSLLRKDALAAVNAGSRLTPMAAWVADYTQ